MSKMVRIRDVPDHVHRILKARATREGMSLSDFIKRELEQAAEQSTIQEWLERTRKSKPIRANQSAAQILRELRDER